MPGSGKTASIIALVNRMRAAGERVFLFVRIDAPEFADYAPLRDHGSIASRSGTSCSVDFADTIAGTKATLIDLLNQSPATLVFEEAQYFGLELADQWG